MFRKLFFLAHKLTKDLQKNM